MAFQRGSGKPCIPTKADVVHAMHPADRGKHGSSAMYLEPEITAHLHEVSSVGAAMVREPNPAIIYLGCRMVAVPQYLLLRPHSGGNISYALGRDRWIRFFMRRP